jgi:ankyrin repeat protein
VRACLFLLVHLSRLQNDTILHIAAREGNYEFVQAFLESHPSFPLTDWQNTNGHTAVIVACMNGQAEVAELLVRFGADLCLVDSNVCTERMLDQYIMTTCTWSANLHTHTHTLSLSLSLCLSACLRCIATPIHSV